MPIIRLESSDKEIFTTDLEIMKCSEVIRLAYMHLGDADDGSVLPLPKVNSVILKMIINWATYHEHLPRFFAVKNNVKTPYISAWDANFLNVDQSTLCDLILAANYLNIEELSDITCKMVANMIKGKTPQEIRDTFSLENDFCMQEEEQLFKENE